MEKQRDFKIFSGFILKVMAIIFMTFDHVGVVLHQSGISGDFATILRIFGRLAFPLFVFLLVEGVRHTKSIGKYFLRLGILAFAFFLGQLFYYLFVSKDMTGMYSPVIDLLLTACAVYLLKRKDKLSFLALLPIAWSILVLIVRNYEINNFTEIKWVPFFLRPDYQIYGPLLGIGFYYSFELAPLFLKSNEGTKDLAGTTYEQTTANVMSAIVLIILTIAIIFIDRNAMHTYFSMPWQVYSLFAFIPILFYSGKRGYNAKWFQYGCYIYFPVHLIIIFGLFILLF